jgi:LuxR family transcriptional regulator, maltose regulon positive regulatory protein
MAEGGERDVFPAGVPGEPAGSAGAIPPSRHVSVDAPIETKLHPPAAHKDWVARGELLGHLASVTARLLLVNAPAGFGKTTLVAQWESSATGTPSFAWLSLDPGDNDAGRLWWHVVWSLQRACPQFRAENILPALRVQAPDFAGTVVPLLVNELSAVPEPVVLVMDDYQVITDRGCHDQVAFLLLNLPPAVRLVVITRVYPPLPLAELEAAGELVTVGARELRFATAEAGQLIAAAAGVELSQPDLGDLVDRTEGWPAGLYLAALSLRGHPSPTTFIRQFTGSSRFIIDFLAEEVLRRQPPDIRQFLVRTSILSRLCAPLCDAVTASADTAELIDVLQRENLFVVQLDDTRRWFRYHQLFGQALRSELARTEPDIVATLHERASAWYRQSGLADEAIGHARAAGDVSGIIDLIAEHWYAHVNTGQVGTVRGWLRALGDDTVGAHPVAAHCAAWVAALSGDRESLQRWLPIVEAGQHDGPLPDGIGSMQSSSFLLKGTFGFEGIGPMRDAAAEAIALETTLDSPWYALARASYAGALYWSGDIEAAAAQANEALASSVSSGVTRMLGFAVLSLIATDQGSLVQAARLARMACQIVADAGAVLAPQSSLAYTALGAALAGSGQLGAARDELERVLQIRRRQPGISPWPTVELLLRLAPVLSASADWPAAVALLAEGRQILTSSPDGADAQLARLAELERRLPGQPRPTAPDRPLTERERAVLGMLRGPLSLREISQQLYLSPNTVKSHTRSIYRKLGVSTRHDAVIRGQEIGLL